MAEQVKKLTIPCSFGAQKHPVDFYIGQPKPDNHPISNQSNWLSSERGGSVPAEIMDSLQRLHDLSVKNHVPFTELCSYAIESAGGGAGKKDDKSKAAEKPKNIEKKPQAKEVEKPKEEDSEGGDVEAREKPKEEAKTPDIKSEVKPQAEVKEEEKNLKKLPEEKAPIASERPDRDRLVELQKRMDEEKKLQAVEAGSKMQETAEPEQKSAAPEPSTPKMGEGDSPLFSKGDNPLAKKQEEAKEEKPADKPAPGSMAAKFANKSSFRPQTGAPKPEAKPAPKPESPAPKAESSSPSPAKPEAKGSSDAQGFKPLFDVDPRKENKS